MKKNLLLPALLLAGASYAQLSEDLKTYTELNSHLDYLAPEEVILPALDMDKVHAEDNDGKTGERYLISRYHQVDLGLDNSGIWMDVPGGKLWRLEISATGAKGINLYYDKYNLPEGSKLHLYSPDRRMVLGAFGAHNNKETGDMATDILPGSTTILEYFEPTEVMGQGELHIDRVSHCYRNVEEYSNLAERGSDPCQVEVACSEGDEWRPQIRSVVRFLTSGPQGSGLCSGALINNTDEDCKQLLLSADHCTGSSDNLSQYVITFNRQRQNCTGTSAESQGSLTGVSLVSRSNDGGGNNGSDYFLCELTSSIPASYNVHYAGWNRSTTAATSGVSIHHPSGDYKKISTYTSNLVNSGWGTANTHWRVVWSGTTNGHGVTEGGSSGSPIFNQDGLIVGQLTGGSSYCNEVQAGGQNQPDYYGKMSYNWQSNNNPIGGDLKNHLDPGNTGATTLSGQDEPCVNSIEENILNNLTEIYPNPSNGNVFIRLDEKLEDLNVQIIDATGKLVREINLSNSYGIAEDMSELDKGIYFVNFITPNFQTSKKLILE